jgi:hypothetical protein
LSAALKPDHSWVYWRDVDIIESEKSIIEDFIAHDRDILVPSKLFLLEIGFAKVDGRTNRKADFVASVWHRYLVSPL